MSQHSVRMQTHVPGLGGLDRKEPCYMTLACSYLRLSLIIYDTLELLAHKLCGGAL